MSRNDAMQSLFVTTEHGAIESLLTDEVPATEVHTRPRGDSGTNFRARYYRQLRMPVPYCPLVQADVCSVAPSLAGSPRSTPPVTPSAYAALPGEGEDALAVDGNVVVYRPSANFVKSVFNLSNTTVGAGTLLLPFAIAKCGVVPGVILLTSMAACAAYSLHLLILVGRATGANTYMESARRCFGSMGEWFVKIMIIILTFGALASYLVIIGQYFTDLLGEIPNVPVDVRKWWVEPAVMGVITFLFILPLSMLKDMSSLSFASLASLAAVAYVIVLVAYEAIKYIVETGGIHPSVKWQTIDSKPMDILQAVPIIGLAFVNQVNIYQVVGELKRPTPARASMVIDATTVICVFIYGVTGVMGYFRYGHNVDGNVLRDKAAVGWPFIVAKAAMGISVVLSYPLVLFPCRACLDTIVHGAFSKCFNGNSEKPPAFSITNLIFFIETVIIVLSSFVVAASVPKITVLFSLTFALTGPSIVYFLPAFFYIRLMPDKWYSCKKVMCYALCIVATIIMVLSLYGSVIEIIDLVKLLKSGKKV